MPEVMQDKGWIFTPHGSSGSIACWRSRDSDEVRDPDGGQEATAEIEESSWL